MSSQVLGFICLVVAALVMAAIEEDTAAAVLYATSFIFYTLQDILEEMKRNNK